MPWITIDYSDNLKSSIKLTGEIVVKMHELIAKTINTSVDACKTKCNIVTEYFVADHSSKQGIFLCTIQILPGRTAEVKQDLQNKLIDFFKVNFKTTISTEICVSIEELHNYAKANMHD